MTTIVDTGASLRTSKLFPTLSITAWVSTVLLILVGSIVRVTGHGLGCPDWPLCYGQAIPPGFLGAWVEFSHRLFGAATSAQIFIVAALAWREHRDQRWIFRPAMAAGVLLIIQIVLGGLHVILEIPPQTGLIHTGVAMLIVGLLALLLAQTSGSLRRVKEAMPRFPTLVSASTGVTYILLLTGSYVTRTGASLACLSFPSCGSLETTTRQLVEIHILHRIVAFTIAGLTIVIVSRLLRRSRDPAVRRFSWILAGVLVLQFALGVSNVLFLLPMWSRVLHLTVGASFWSVMVVLWTITRTKSLAPAA
jgi:heme A synthase